MSADGRIRIGKIGTRRRFGKNLCFEMVVHVSTHLLMLFLMIHLFVVVTTIIMIVSMPIINILVRIALVVIHSTRRMVVRTFLWIMHVLVFMIRLFPIFDHFVSVLIVVETKKNEKFFQELFVLV